jgi:creatinine amidohydrolase
MWQPHLEHLTWKQAEEVLAAKPVVLIPVGAVEAHGAHLPLGADSMVAQEVAVRAAQLTESIVVPPIWYGYSPSWRNFPGSLSVRPETVLCLAEDIIRGLSQFGPRHFVFVNSHGGNEPPLEQVAYSLQHELKILVAHYYPWRVMGVYSSEINPDYSSVRGHGAEPNSSVLAYLFPNSVDFTLASTEALRSWKGLKLQSARTTRSQGATIELYPELDQVIPSGVTSGDPTSYSVELGEKLVELTVNALVAFLQVFLLADPSE